MRRPPKLIDQRGIGTSTTYFALLPPCLPAAELPFRVVPLRHRGCELLKRLHDAARVARLELRPPLPPPPPPRTDTCSAASHRPPVLFVPMRAPYVPALSFTSASTEFELHITHTRRCRVQVMLRRGNAAHAAASTSSSASASASLLSATLGPAAGHAHARPRTL
jgi:hypothetical protein